ncbi:M20 family metallopeptidase [Pseudomonas sp. NPDC088368]|uniref:M20 family metallopeptidase n=1 Tax=Pseudomonas sp. NPDC088368 TaxID=3364453 RepID=UPI00381387AD
MPLSLRDPIALTRHLVCTNTINPPGNEGPLVEELERALKTLGLTTLVQSIAPGRANLLAWNPSADGSRLCFTGHLDTVPLGAAPWVQAPLGGEVIGDRLYGRGASDMKGGIAAFLCALHTFATRFGSLPPVLVVLTAGEETGCEGAKRLAELDLSGLDVGALLIGEPTANQCVVGHKGALWLTGQATGKTAHGAMPELGDNAIYHAVDAIQKLRQFDFCTPVDPLLGSPTLNIGTITGGMNVNSVPDTSAFTIDIRTVCGLSHKELCGRVGDHIGGNVKLSATVDVPALSNDLANPWIRQVTESVAFVTGEQSAVRTVAFFTDGPVLRELFGEVPAIVIGPGEPSCAHQTDEWCSVRRVHECVDIYSRLLEDWQS